MDIQVRAHPSASDIQCVCAHRQCVWVGVYLMSVRFPLEVPLSRCGSGGAGDAEIGSLFGKTLDSDLWARLAGSPMMRPNTPLSDVSSLHFDRAESVDGDKMDIDFADLNIDASSHAGGVLLDSVVHTHALPVDFAYAYFERDTGVAQLRAPNGKLVSNANPVVPRVVYADACVWQPVLSSCGKFGHKFMLLHGEAIFGCVEVGLALFLNRSGAEGVRYIEAGVTHVETLIEALGATAHNHDL